MSTHKNNDTNYAIFLTTCAASTTFTVGVLFTLGSLTGTFILKREREREREKKSIHHMKAQTHFSVTLHVFLFVIYSSPTDPIGSVGEE